MSDTVLIVLIIAIAVIVVLVIFRKQVSRFFIKASKEGVEANLETHESTPPATSPTSRPGTVNVSGNVQKGTKNVIDVTSQSGAAVKNNQQDGKDQQIKVRSGSDAEQPKP